MLVLYIQSYLVNRLVVRNGVGIADIDGSIGEDGTK
uniref:Uncharacterized protein n=1 Tax=Lotus japonicus TaxID=34305 RepID=I3T6R8_LOTJA|nr:unknown [Lotus japonicus]